MSFEQFHDAERDRLVRLLALEIQDVETAVAAIDEALTRAAQHWDRIVLGHDPGAWVHRVGYRWARSPLRRWRSPDVGRAPSRAAPRASGGPGTVRLAVDALSVGHRAVVVLRVHAGLSSAATAAALGIPRRLASARYRRALELLRYGVGDGS